MDESEPRIKWTYIGDRRFEEPFMSETLGRCREFEQNDRSRPRITSIEKMAVVAAGVKSLPLSAFIFHISRCGSTLLGQALVQMEENAVLSEPPILDQALRLHLSHKNFAGERQDTLIRDVVKLLASSRNPEERRLIIKTDCWHLLVLDKLTTLYPDVKRIFLYRNPDDVMLSHRKMRGTASVPGMVEEVLSGVGVNPEFPGDLDGYLAGMLGAMMSRMKTAYRPGKDLLLSYHEGNEALISRVLSFLGLEPSPGEMEKIHQRMKRHSKEPSSVFDVQTDRKGPAGAKSYPEIGELFGELNRLNETGKH